MPPDDLHPYDGKERRFRHDDADSSQRDRARALVARLLGLAAPPPPEGLRYDLCFYSGGIGVLDRLHVALPCAPAEVDAIVARLGLATPEAAVADAAWCGDFNWLVRDEDEPLPLRAAVAVFIEKQRADFQPSPEERSRVWFFPESGVNAWLLVYEQDGELGYIAFEQG